MEIKWIIPPIIAAGRRLSKIIQETKKAVREGITTKIAITDPFRIISFIVSLSGLLVVISFMLVFDNKNQKYFIFGKNRFFVFGKLQRNVF